VTRERLSDPATGRLGNARSTPPSRREARLKPEFAHLYPPLKAGQWESAATMADRLVAWLLGKKQKKQLGYVSSERVLRPEHFEFRSGETSDTVQ